MTRTRAPEPVPRTWQLRDKSGTEFTVFGSLLGRATSEQDEHNDHVGAHAGRGERCSACRWFEVLILNVSEDEEAGVEYLLYTVGRSIVPGETDRIRTVWTDSPRKVVAALVVRQDGQPRLPIASDWALAEASDLDDDIADAYENRLVA